MDAFVVALLLSTLPALGYVLGGLFAEIIDTSRRLVVISLHGAAGVVLSAVTVELLPEALQSEPGWIILLFFILGGVFFFIMEWLISTMQKRLSGSDDMKRPWAIFFGVGIDLFNDGIMIGAGTTISLSLGLILAMAQVPANIPEAFATIAVFRQKQFARWKRVPLSLAFSMPILLGTTLGYWVVKGQPELVKHCILAFTAGVLMTLVEEEIVPEAHREQDVRLATLVFLLGFAIFTMISMYFD